MTMVYSHILDYFIRMEISLINYYLGGCVQPVEHNEK